MKSIDLKKFALYSQKLPEAFLDSTTEAPKMSLAKVLAAHFMDMGLCLSGFGAMVALYNVTVRSLLVTSKLQFAFSEEYIGQISMFFLPLVVSSYFFTSYFMNNGQTWGMNLFKARLKVKEQSFRESLMWAIHSTLLCFSAGTLLVASKTKWQDFSHKDYLYQELMLHRDSSSVNLFSLIEETHEEEHYSEIAKAA